MKRAAAGLVGSVALVVMLFFSLGLAASGKAAPAQKMNMDMSKKSMSGMKKMDAAGTVFCPGMSTGQLCPYGTVATLKLTGERKQRWGEAVSGYNKTVGAATQQLLRSVKPVLSSQQYAQVQRWFSVGLNPQINLLLQENERSHR
jgi:hypothetical protein